MDRDTKILVAGARGMVGSALVRRLRADGHDNLLTPSRAELDLLDQRATLDYLAHQRPDYVVVAAAKVGGILANNVYRADFLYENLAIETHLIHGAHRADVPRLLFLGSSCIYPRDCAQPIHEDALLTGPLEATNEPYAIAKIAGIKLCESFNAQYGRRYISVMPTNLYGPNDHYDLNNSHVLPALIRKFHLAKLSANKRFDDIAADERRHGRIADGLLQHLGLQRHTDGTLTAHPAQLAPKLEIWGSGSPRREFLHVDDLADACVHLMNTDYAGPLVNIGCGEDVTIRELAQTIGAVVGFDGELVFDASKPDGTPRKLLDVSRMNALGWRARIGLREGVADAYAAYLASVR